MTVKLVVEFIDSLFDDDTWRGVQVDGDRAEVGTRKTASEHCLTGDSRFGADGCRTSSHQFRLHVKTVDVFLDWLHSIRSMSVNFF